MYETNFYCEDEDEVAFTPDAIYVSVLDSGDVDSITTFNAELISEDETFKVGSYGETVKFQLSKQDSTLLDISGTEAIMLMNIQSRSYSFSMVIDDEESGIVSYTFEDGDLDKSGYAHIEIELDTLTKKLISENSVSLVIKNRV